MTRYQRLAADIGGKHLLYLPIYLVAIPILLVTSIWPSLQPGSFQLFPGYLVANVVSIGITFLVFLLFDKVIFKSRFEKPIPVPAVLAFAALLGATKGITTALGLTQLGIDPDLWASVGQRVPSTVVIGLIVVPVSSVFIASRERFTSLREELVLERVLSESGESANEQSILKLKQFVSEAKEELENLSSWESRDGKSIASLIRSIVDSRLRPMSHKLWEAENRRQAGFSLTDLLRLAILRYPLAPLGVAVPFFVTVLQLHINSSSVSVGLISTFLQSLYLFLAIVVINGFRKRLQSNRSLFISYLLTLAILQFGISLISTISLGAAAANWFLILVSFIWVSNLAITTSVFMAALRLHDEQKKQLGELIAQREARGQHLERVVANREFANYLHGSVQNRLLATAVRLEDAETTPETLANELRAVNEVLDELLIDYGSSNSDLESQLNQLRENWSGLIEINLDLDGDALTPRVPMIITEAVNNAYRHGKASVVDVKLSGNNLIIRDNGKLVTSKAGLGSQLFDSVSDNWTLTASDSGSVLEIELS